MITRETIDTIINATHLLDVVQDFVHLKKRGVNYLGNCPFHNEKTPSFTVSPVKDIYKCFGCGKAGNAVTFLMEHENFSYPETLRYLANKYNITIEETANTKEQEEQKTEQESLLIILSAAQKYYTSLLLETEEGKTLGLSYFKEREVTKSSIETFALGWSPSGKNNFTEWALNNGYLKEFLLKSGLSFETEKGELLDRFRERILFPIHNIAGKVIGFGGRILKSTGKEAKYINSPETEVYHKSKILYGIFQAKKMIRQKDECIVAEGYMDVIGMYQCGVENIVASGGTSLTTEQLKVVKRFTNNVIFMFDGDDAGQNAAMRGIDLALEEGLNVRLVTLPAEHDPDSFAKAYDKEYVEKYITGNAVDFVEYKAGVLLNKAAGDVVRRSEAMRETMTSVSFITDPISRSLFVKKAEKIFGVEEKVLYEELQRISIKKFKEENKTDDIRFELKKEPQPSLSLEARFAVQEKYLIRNLLVYGSREYNESMKVKEKIMKDFPDVEWEDKRCEKIFHILYNPENEDRDFTYFINSEDEDMRNFVSALVMETQKLDARWEEKTGRVVMRLDDTYREDVDCSVDYLQLKNIMRNLIKTGELIRQAAKSGNTSEETEWMEVKIDLNRRKKEICEKYGISILPEDNSWKNNLTSVQSSSPD